MPELNPMVEVTESGFYLGAWFIVGKGVDLLVVVHRDSKESTTWNMDYRFHYDATAHRASYTNRYHAECRTSEQTADDVIALVDVMLEDMPNAATSPGRHVLARPESGGRMADVLGSTLRAAVRTPHRRLWHRHRRPHGQARERLMWTVWITGQEEGSILVDALNARAAMVSAAEQLTKHHGGEVVEINVWKEGWRSPIKRKVRMPGGKLEIA